MPPPDPPRALAVPGAIPLQDGRVYILWAKCASAQKAPGGSPMLGVLYATPTSPTWRVTEGPEGPRPPAREGPWNRTIH